MRIDKLIGGFLSSKNFESLNNTQIVMATHTDSFFWSKFILVFEMRENTHIKLMKQLKVGKNLAREYYRN